MNAPEGRDASAAAAFLGQRSPLRYAADGDRIQISTGERRLGVLTAAPTPGELSVRLESTGAFEPAEARALVDALVAMAVDAERPAIRLSTLDAVARDAARAAGFAGALRHPLVVDLSSAVPPGGGRRGLAPMLEDLLPGVAVRPAPPPGRFRRLVHQGMAGFAGMLTIVVQPTDEQPLRIALPDRSDVMAESVAEAVDTSLAVRRKFHSSLVHVKAVSFDHSDQGFVQGRYAGTAVPLVGIIHLNANLVLEAGPATLVRQRQVNQGNQVGRPSAAVAAPFSRVDATTAHEWWHQIDALFQARRYRESIDFRRELGHYFGVDTIEHASRGATDGAPATWRQAYERLGQEVSPYATTNPREATAELFKLWWCTVGEPAPAVRVFGELLERYFGVRTPR